jgi:hypothetical protein
MALCGFEIVFAKECLLTNRSRGNPEFLNSLAES